jgi:LysM repeat protein
MRCNYEYYYYKIKHGDTLTKISNSHKVRTVDIIKINENNKIRSLKEGQTIKIPSDNCCCKHGRFYVIKKGDTLASISSDNKISPDLLLSSNPYFNPSYYLTGQVIIIPCPLLFNDKTLMLNHTKYKQYQIAQGEDMISICKKFNIKPTELLETNPGIKPLEFIPEKIIFLPNKK